MGAWINSAADFYPGFLDISRVYIKGERAMIARVADGTRWLEAASVQ